MGFIITLILLVAIFLAIGSVLGWTAASKASRLEEALKRVETRLFDLERLAREPSRPAATPALKETPDAGPPAAAPPAAVTRQAPKPPPQPVPRPVTAARVEVEPPAPREPGFFDQLFDNVRRNWMAWLGGVSVSLAGIFLVGYGIEMGYLGPRARITAAVIGGLLLHAAADYFRRKTKTSHPAFAAMAGGGSITLYAALFAALELYGLMSPGLTFTLLAIISLATMALATVHGAPLAILGILGGYTVPILVTEHAGGSLVELTYSFIITSAALFLIRFVYRPWLWYGTIAGALGWWLISLTNSDADGYRGFYLAAIAFAALAIPTLDWALNRVPRETDPAADRIPLGESFSIQAIQLTIALIVIAQAFSIVNLGFTGLVPSTLLWSPLIAIVLWATKTRDSLELAPWLVLVTQLGAWFITALDSTSTGVELVGLAATEQREFLGFSVLMALLFSLGSIFTNLGKAYSHLRASLVWLSPVLWLALAYLLVTDLSTDWRWSAAALALGLGFVAVAGFRLQKDPGDSSVIWPILAGHLAYSLAVAMLFREASLTLALATQVISLAWLSRRFELAALGWLIKGVLAIVVVRLTLNPALLTYASDTHWSLWTYGGSMLCCFIGAWLTSPKLPLRKWLEAAGLHLLVLFLGAEVRYWLYDGEIFIDDFTLTEAAINTTLWAGLGLSYFNRARLSVHLTKFYAFCSRLLLVLALMSYAIALVFLNPLWGNEPISATPLWNIMLLAYGAPVVLAAIAWFAYDPAFKKLAAAVAGGGLFAFVTLEIRHLWHGGLDLDLGTTNSELYSYSAAWLVMAVVTMLAATRFGSRDAYRVGSGFLLLVIAKIFLFDMAELEGLLRVASFMGLGLALLGLGWLYQRTTKQESQA